MILQKGYSRDHSIGTHVVMVKVVTENITIWFVCHDIITKYLFFIEGNKYIKLMLGTLFSKWHHSNTICCEKCSACNNIQTKKSAFPTGYLITYVEIKTSIKNHDFSPEMLSISGISDIT
jgi:hypothetical protein